MHDYAKAKVQEVKPKQKPEIIIDKEGFNILLSQAPVNDPELDFRKLVERYATEGQITIAGNYILRVKRQELGITEERSDEIVDEVLAPYRKRIENIKLYRQAFTEAVAQNYPLTERLLNELRDLEDILGLEDKDIAQIQQQILAEKEAEDRLQQEVQQQEQEEYENKLQQYEQEFLKAVEQEYPLSENARNQINILQQSLGLRDEDIRQIEQPILAAKYREKLKVEERQRKKEQESERAKQLELQEQQESEDYENKIAISKGKTGEALGVETWGGVMTAIIPKNTLLPVRRSEVFSTAVDGQDNVEIHLLKGNHELAKDNVSLGTFRVNEIPPAPKGVPQIEVTFDIDETGILSVSAKDKGTGKEASVTI